MKKQIETWSRLPADLLKMMAELWNGLCLYPLLLGQYILFLWRQLSKNELRKRLMLQGCFVLLLQMAVALVLGEKSAEAMDCFLSIILPVTILSMVLLGYGMALKANQFYAFCCCLLITIGCGLQILVRLPLEEGATAYDLAGISWFSGFVGLLCVPMVEIFLHRLSRATAEKMLFVLTVVCYLVLFLFGRDAGDGTTCWLVIGSVSFQLTEICKLIEIFYVALVLTDEEKREEKRIFNTIALMVVNVLCLFKVGELGTLVVEAAATVVLLFLFASSKKLLLKSALAVALSVGLMLGVCCICHERIGQYQEQTTVVAQETAVSIVHHQPSKLTQFFGSKLYPKIINRFRLAYDLETMIQEDEENGTAYTYQSRQARSALYLAGWFGSEYIHYTHVPVAESDFMFTYIVKMLGAATGILILLTFLAMQILTGKSLCETEVEYAAVGLGFLFVSLLQALMSCGSAAGVWPLTGVPIMFLSKGNANAVISYCMAFCVLWCSRGQEVLEMEAET